MEYIALCVLMSKLNSSENDVIIYYTEWELMRVINIKDC